MLLSDPDVCLISSPTTVPHSQNNQETLTFISDIPLMQMWMIQDAPGLDSRSRLELQCGDVFLLQPTTSKSWHLETHHFMPSAMKQHLILRMVSCILLHFLSAAVRYLGSMEACASCSSRPQTSLVIGWREKDSRCVRLTTFATKRGVWDMDHHRGLNLIGGDKTLASKLVPTSHLCGRV